MVISSYYTTFVTDVPDLLFPFPTHRPKTSLAIQWAISARLRKLMPEKSPIMPPEREIAIFNKRTSKKFAMSESFVP